MWALGAASLVGLCGHRSSEPTGSPSHGPCPAAATSFAPSSFRARTSACTSLAEIMMPLRRAGQASGARWPRSVRSAASRLVVAQRPRRRRRLFRA